MTGFFLLSHIAPNTQCVITDSHAKSLEPWYSTEHWVPSHPLLLNVPSLFPSLYISAPTHRISTYHTSWEGDTWSSLFLWPIWSMTIANAKKGKKTLSFQINGLTWVLELLCQDACNRALYHCPWEALFGTIGQKRKTPGTSQRGIYTQLHQIYKCW